MFVYYFTGNIVFGVALYQILMPADRPIQGYLNLARDIRDAEMNRFYSLFDYLDNFKDNRLVTIYEQDIPRMQTSIKGPERVDAELRQIAETAPDSKQTHSFGDNQVTEGTNQQDLRKLKDLPRDSHNTSRD